MKDMRFVKDDWKFFLVCLFGGVYVYFAKIVNELANPDAIWNGMAYKSGYSWETGLGRYMIGFLQKIRSNIISTEFVSLACLVFLAITCVLVVKIFEIEDIISRTIIGALIILTPTVGSTLTYYYCSDMYFLSYCLAVLAVLFAVKYRNVTGVCICAIGICLSTAIYQAYLGIAITLCFLYLLYMLLDSQYSMRDIGRWAIHLLVGGCSGIILYLLSNSVIQHCLGVSAVEARGFSSMGKISVSELPKLIKSAYVSFYEYFFSSTMINNHWGWRYNINCLFFLCAVIILIVILVKKRIPLHRKLFFLLGIILLPISVMSIVIIAPEASIYGPTGVLMLPTMNYVYIAAFVLFVKSREEVFSIKMQKVIKLALMGCCICVCYMLLMLELSSQTYMKHHMNKTETVALMMMNEIEEVTDNNCSYKICVVGTMEDGNYPEIYEALRSSVQWTTAYHKTIWTTFDGTQSCWANYMSHYLGKTYSICSYEEYNKVLQSAEYSSMQNFPDENSVIVIDDIIVVKLSNG